MATFLIYYLKISRIVCGSFLPSFEGYLGHADRNGPRLLQASRLGIFVMLVFVTTQSSVRAEHCFRTGFEEYIHNVAIPEHEHVTEADGFQLAG